MTRVGIGLGQAGGITLEALRDLEEATPAAVAARSLRRAGPVPGDAGGVPQ